jgi:hypothetical protein
MASFRALFAPIPCADATGWVAGGLRWVTGTGCGIDIVVREHTFGRMYRTAYTHECLHARVWVGDESVTRQITRLTRVWYGYVYAVSFGRYDRWISRALLEIFGHSLATAPVFFVEMPRRTRPVGFRDAVARGLIKRLPYRLRDTIPPPGCIIRKAHDVYFGEYDEISSCTVRCMRACVMHM